MHSPAGRQLLLRYFVTYKQYFFMDLEKNETIIND